MDKIDTQESEHKTETMTFEEKDDVSEESYISKSLTAKIPQQ